MSRSARGGLSGIGSAKNSLVANRDSEGDAMAWPPADWRASGPALRKTWYCPFARNPASLRSASLAQVAKEQVLVPDARRLERLPDHRLALCGLAAHEVLACDPQQRKEARSRCPTKYTAPSSSARNAASMRSVKAPSRRRGVRLALPRRATRRPRSGPVGRRPNGPSVAGAVPHRPVRGTAWPAARRPQINLRYARAYTPRRTRCTG